MVIQGIAVPGYKASQEEWILFYRRLRERFGKLEADEIFLSAFSQGADEALRNNADFRRRMQSHGLEISSTGLGGFFSELSANSLFSPSASKTILVVLLVAVGLWFAARVLPQGRLLSAVSALKNQKK